jgi:hypothetical protein
MSNTLKPAALRPALPASWEAAPWNFQRAIAQSRAQPMKRMIGFFGRRKPSLFHRCLAVHIIAASQPGALQ